MNKSKQRSNKREKRLRAQRFRNMKAQARRNTADRSVFPKFASYTVVGVAAIWGVVLLVAPGLEWLTAAGMASMLVCFVALAILRHMGMPSKNGLPISVVASVSGIMGISFIIVSEILKAGGS
ncbi:hypothetical protein [Streptosporangium lutulentum]|uniref:Uncharacterized protein n=1 Tax=Streptosporangium lutulentum TaxID=1461250 RepID=A0ABT9QAY7_9ACTN|nr:hypothetical protein [Streptosporangium lutulentum]MDP9843932.1 hypothetical protein [Streptosporangium lutulentum]